MDTVPRKARSSIQVLFLPLLPITPGRSTRGSSPIHLPMSKRTSIFSTRGELRHSDRSQGPSFMNCPINTIVMHTSAPPRPTCGAAVTN